MAQLRRVETAGHSAFLDSRVVPLMLSSGLAIAGVLAGFWLGADHADDWLLASRYTARASFAVFLIVYSASSLLRLWPGALRALWCEPRVGQPGRE